MANGDIKYRDKTAAVSAQELMRRYDLSKSFIGGVAGGESAVYEQATVATDGLMSAEDKQKLNGIAEGAQANVNADWNASTGSAMILNKPTIPAVPVISTDISADEQSNVKTASPKAVKTYVDGAVASSAQQGSTGITITKVWESPTPSAQYSSGSVSADLSGYDLLCVIFFAFPTEHWVISTTLPVGENGTVYYETKTMGGGTNASRRFYTSNTGVVFDPAYRGYNSTYDGVLLPVMIYGISGVQTI